MHPLAIRGPVLTLRYPRPGDAPALFSLASDPEVTRYFSWGPYERIQQAEAFIASLPARRETGELLDLAIVHPQHGPIGITGLTELARRDRRATVGTWLGRDHWGTGANREAKALVMALAFDHLGLERLTAYAAAGNARSQRALAAVGFAHEGELRRYHRHGDRVYDVTVHGLLRRDWATSALRAEIPAAVEGELPAAFRVA